MSRSSWRGVVFVTVIVLVASAGIWYSYRPPARQSGFRTTVVKQGDLLATVAATGTIEPEEVVDVGAQVGGIIKEFGRDPTDETKPIDYLSVVETGTVLARIDESIYRARLDKADAQIEQTRAQLEQIKATIRSAEADVLQMKAKFFQADRQWSRTQKLLSTKVITESEADVAQADFEVAKAAVSVAEAAVDQAKANLHLAEKTLLVSQADRAEAQRNLDYTVIASPVKGVIIDRRVNVGQTVVSSLNAPSLFLIAKDLTRLQVWASVNEADIGRLHAGLPVTFTVDAFPDEIFQGQVSQVRLNATMTQNVVTYTVVVNTENSNGRLIPYLTTNLYFEVGQRQNCLLIPNSALRWQPKPEQISPNFRSQFQTASDGRKSVSSPTASAKKPHDRGQVWCEDQGFVRPVEVRLGLTDGVHTEITEGELKENDLVVVGEKLPTETADSTSPFAPKMFGGGRR